MAGRTLGALLVALVLSVPATASAEPIKVQPRLVPGDSLHYTNEGHMTFAASSPSADAADGPTTTKVDYNIGVLLTVEELSSDGSARVREEIDQVDVAGVDPSESDQLLGRQFTVTVHPDGSWTDFQSDDDPLSSSLLTSLLPGAGNGSFPVEGLNVGQTAERKIPFNLLGPDTPIDLPVRTTLEGLAFEDGHPAAKLKQTFSVPQTETQLGNIGIGTLHISGDASYSVDLDTGWPLRAGGVIGYSLAFHGQGDQQGASIDVQLQYGLVLDQLSLADH